MRYLYMEQIIVFIANIDQLPMPSKLCWLQNQSCSCWPRSAQDFAALLTSFWWFQNSTVDERRASTQKLLSLDFLKAFECWLIMFWLNELLQVTTRSLVASNSVTFSRQMRGLCSSPLHKKPNSCRAILNFIECWLIMSHLSELLQVTTRSLAASNFVTFFSTNER